jgi:hypothetical protein
VSRKSSARGSTVLVQKRALCLARLRVLQKEYVARCSSLVAEEASGLGALLARLERALSAYVNCTIVCAHKAEVLDGITLLRSCIEDCGVELGLEARAGRVSLRVSGRDWRSGTMPAQQQLGVARPVHSGAIGVTASSKLVTDVLKGLESGDEESGLPSLESTHLPSVSLLLQRTANLFNKAMTSSRVTRRSHIPSIVRRLALWSLACLLQMHEPSVLPGLGLLQAEGWLILCASYSAQSEHELALGCARAARKLATAEVREIQYAFGLEHTTPEDLEPRPTTSSKGGLASVGREREALSVLWCGCPAMVEDDAWASQSFARWRLRAGYSVIAMAGYNAAAQREHLGKLDAAADEYHRALVLARQRLGESHPLVVELETATKEARTKALLGTVPEVRPAVVEHKPTRRAAAPLVVKPHVRPSTFRVTRGSGLAAYLAPPATLPQSRSRPVSAAPRSKLRESPHSAKRPVLRQRPTSAVDPRHKYERERAAWWKEELPQVPVIPASRSKFKRRASDAELALAGPFAIPMQGTPALPELGVSPPRRVAAATRPVSAAPAFRISPASERLVPYWGPPSPPPSAEGNRPVPTPFDDSTARDREIAERVASDAANDVIASMRRFADELRQTKTQPRLVKGASLPAFAAPTE